MGAYKKLNKQDAYITTYTAHKTWAVPSGSFGEYGLQVLTATGSYSSSLKQLYYPSKSLSNVVSHSYDYYDQTTLYYSQSRNYQPNPLIVSIPRDLYGVTIPADSSFSITLQNDDLYAVVGYWDEGYVGTGVESVVDDGEGNLYIEGMEPRVYVGDIIYPHGIAIITNPIYSGDTVSSVTFKSSQPIFTHNYHCKIRESEFNFTYNPSCLSGSNKTVYDNEGNVYSTSASISDGVLKSNITGSSFQPYITTVGLYNDTNELIAVGKLSNPVPKSANTEMTIIVKIDI